MTSMSVEQYRREILKQGDKPKAVKRNKFNAQKVECDGMTFDSKKEHRRYIELKAMQQRGEIFGLEHHTKFELAPKTQLKGEKRAKPALRYFADFTYYIITGEYVVEDVKSAATRKKDSYRNKKHLMKTVLNIDVREV
ncbi:MULTISPECIES: DUF1064 domain-containing protein [unclassified Acinetobacter]|uniref:DUF1064 domain-containing protein n=1 Tax=unclassified Acinetobacter TaxID=196816 RepID=UPI0024480BA3|nr:MULTISPECIES: DUF1064 domain-containing protein [unclassified Acinetobacter]MDH0032029.1 DUF1064 domain-containing protein [Acinetobacter sp. GD04021]MDH0887685.1 DUF1064 domain-containing protein [Acinetobacter sp. GD03873]MDH1084033.1 DUF1064 domain-containing protein [Acinetobacter sp. GD03983]MDH2191040.1 DUF1064 domain-containing protein [Acinetobacter sp. GD03645]MDH2204545.1 DUF1064 domain-containing protein [Acinetobacter sp. GD03647]